MHNCNVGAYILKYGCSFPTRGGLDRSQFPLDLAQKHSNPTKIEEDKLFDFTTLNDYSQISFPFNFVFSRVLFLIPTLYSLTHRHLLSFSRIFLPFSSHLLPFTTPHPYTSNNRASFATSGQV